MSTCLPVGVCIRYGNVLMCEVFKSESGLSFCKKTGLPIVLKTPFGLFCDKECNIDSTIFSKSRAEAWIDAMGPIFEQLKEDK